MERTINKAVVLVFGGAILADILTHGQVAVSLGNIFGGIVTSALQATSGQAISSK
jgi:hypothetical protein